MNIKYEQVNNEKIDESVNFIMAGRKVIFPMLEHSKMPEDLINFKQYYMLDKDAYWLNAIDADTNQIVATIAFRKYDHRFPFLSLPRDKKIVELQKLFVDPRVRRNGIAKTLVKIMIDKASEMGINYIYLHTHPFLIGAQQLYFKLGWDYLYNEKNDPWNTIHMLYDVKNGRERK
ncbi:GNAT family N-acetyltransferase [Ureaplasma canigenitalium]|uniref:GNAT family N-acetyltransferase n=1 Tax=Ureaplasma canigenitalium TaxID=42092 RepID=UPI000691147C|nr:GNAT family N-acetyltransferase [Ureaplasma canigenitalium]